MRHHRINKGGLLIKIIQKVIYPLLGIFSFLLLVINMLLFAIMSCILGLLVKLIPILSWRKKALSVIMNCPAVWYRFNYYIMKINIATKWVIAIDGDYNPQGWYLLISNHLSWLDIASIAGVFSFKTSVIKFFMKQELLWTLPIAGLACKLLGFPFLARGKRKSHPGSSSDVAVITKACRQVIDYPTTLFMFIEGTRYTQQKSATQKSPYQHLLRPRVGGFVTVMESMHSKLNGILDVTINYNPRHFSFVDLMLGRVKTIYISARILPIDKLSSTNYKDRKEYKSHVRKWLDEVWQRKDKQITKMRNDE